MTAPEISGVEDGKTYCLTRTITVIDEHLRDVKVNGKRIELDENNQYVLSGSGKQVITATDDYDNVTEIIVTINDHHTEGKQLVKQKRFVIFANGIWELDSANHVEKVKWIITPTTHEQRYSCCNAIAVKRQHISGKMVNVRNVVCRFRLKSQVLQQNPPMELR